MLSVEISPPDLSCSSQSQRLNSNSDERVSTKDLNHHPSFSIRDYVSIARRKDRKKKWPSTVSESMASNVCPVCKTFSSSSNTTLNAHIDQCLSVESTPRWTSDSKLKRQWIKPRKTRSMVDIYSTALPSTLEIDKTGNSNTVNEGKRVRESQSHPKDGDVGPVNVDLNGTQLGILSKFGGLPSVSKVTEDIEARKPQKGDKGGKFVSKKKKKKCLAQKHRGFQKLAPQSKMNFSPNARGSLIVEEECEGEAKGFEEERNGTEQSESLEMKALHVSEQVEEMATRSSQSDQSFQYSEDHKRLLFWTESEVPPAPNEFDYTSDLGMFSEHRQSFPEVDPIPIPGPPGSFLPSPRDMGSEDFQGNSSLTTSQVRSLLDHHDVVDADSSMSAASSAGPSAKSNSSQLEKYGFVDSICEDKGSLGFENVNFQDSQLLRRRTMATTSGGKVTVLRLMGKNLLVLNKDDGQVY